MSIIQQKVTSHVRRQKNTWSEETEQLSEPGSDMSQILELLDGKNFNIIYDAVKVLHSICQQIWKTQQWPQDWKWSVLFPIQKKKKRQCQRMLKLLHNCTHLTH